MRTRPATLVFVLVETVVLLAVVAPVAHVRVLVDTLLLRQTPAVVADEPLFMIARSLLVVVVLQIGFGFRDLYTWAVIMRPQLVVMRLVEAVTTVLVALPILYYVLDACDRAFSLDGLPLRLHVHPLLVIASSGGAFLVSYGLRMRWPRWTTRTGLAERVAILGHGPHVDAVEEELRRRQDPSLTLVGRVATLDEDVTSPVLGPARELEALLDRHAVERLVVNDPEDLTSDQLFGARRRGIVLDDVSDFYERLTGRLSLDHLEDADLFLASQARPSLASTIAKRLIDVVGAALGLLVVSPVGVLVALAIKLDSPGPIFYRQERVGLNGRPFTLTKFRSMRADAEHGSGPVWARRNDTRITRVGRWLRRSRLDELPQLWSVLCNDMSLVGPRPEREHFVRELEAEVPSYSQRHLVKPGVTGWAQISYSYGNSVADAFVKHQYDMYYIKNRSLAFDAAILLRTIKVVVLRQGAV